jgi:hypothetical protein
MIILRQKSYAEGVETEQLSPRDLQLENIRMQRQIMINQRTREKLQADRAKSRMRQIQSAQRMEQQKDMQDEKNRIQVQKMTNSEDDPKNVSLYKTRSTVTKTVSMPK